MEKKQTEEAEASRFHNRLYHAEVSRTPTGPILKLVPNNPSGPFGRPRRIAEHLYEIAAEMERRSHDVGVRWLISVESWSGRIMIETVEGEKADVDEFVANLIRDLEFG